MPSMDGTVLSVSGGDGVVGTTKNHSLYHECIWHLSVIERLEKLPLSHDHFAPHF